jgi:hypothetical protein
MVECKAQKIAALPLAMTQICASGAQASAIRI